MLTEEFCRSECEGCPCLESGVCCKTEGIGTCYAISNANCAKVTNSKKKSTKRSRAYRHKNHMKHLSKCGRGYPAPAELIDFYWCGHQRYTRRKPYYKRFYIGNGNKNGNTTRFFKNYCNRRIRRFNGELGSRGKYKKLTDYWWKIL